MTLQTKQEQRSVATALKDAHLQLGFAWRRQPDDWYVERGAIQEPLTTKLRTFASGVLDDLVTNRAEVVYDPDSQQAETDFYLVHNPTTGSPPSAPVGGNLMPQLSNFAQLPTFGDADRRSAPNLFVLLAQLQDGSTVKMGRSMTARNVLAASRGLRAFWTGETFDLLEDGPVLTIDLACDWVEHHDEIVILNVRGYHAAFRTAAQLRTAVPGHVQAIHQKIKIQNVAEFVARCERMPSMASKLETVVSQKLYEKPIADLQSYSSRYPELGVEWDGDELVFPSDLDRQWGILRLLDEAGFTGELSGLKFEAPSKRGLA